MAKRPSSRSTASDTGRPDQPNTQRRPTETAPAPSVDDSRNRAYERYLERGGGDGRHFDDWVEAEKELRNKK
jgi:hypothetical protein